MHVDTGVFALAPECLLLIGACGALTIGLVRGRSAPFASSLFALVLVVLALILSLWFPASHKSEVLPGLWLTPFTNYARTLTLVMGILVILVNWRQPARQEHGEFMCMILLSLLGVLITASANDWIVFFFAIELVSVPTYILVAMSREAARSTEAAVKYFFLGALSAAVLAYGLSFLYGAAGTTTIHRLSDGSVTSSLSAAAADDPRALVGLLLVIASLFFKIAAVPFHVYVADVYEGAASPIAGMLGFVPKFAGLLALCKVLTAFQWDLPSSVLWILWVTAAVTMTVGNTLGLLQRNVKRMLAYSSIAHTGYMLVALLVGPIAGQGPLHDGLAAMFFYIAVYGAMNLGAFAVLASIRIADRDAESVDDLAGLCRRAPATALALAVCMFSLMGLPPTAGFMGKLYIFAAAFSVRPQHPMHAAMIVLAVIGVINAAIGAAYYLRVVASVYVGREVQTRTHVGGAPIRLALAVCGLSMLFFFLRPALLLQAAAKPAAAVRQTIQSRDARWTIRSPAPNGPAPGAAVVDP